MEFKPILSESDLPNSDSEHENQYFDFKLVVPMCPHMQAIVINEWRSARYSVAQQNSEIERDYKLKARIGFDYFEIAKDIAAFSNSLGGLIIYGAAGSDRGGRKVFLSRYTPVSRDVAEIWHAEVNQAIMSRCMPSPIVDLRIIPQETGWLLAVNIQAYPRQPIGVRLKSNSKLIDGYGADSYVFPLRVAEQTTFISPEQLPMFIDPTIRANGIYLSGIVKEQADEKKRKIRLSGPSSIIRNHQPFIEDVILISVDILSNTFTVSLPGIGKPLGLPISATEHVWKLGDALWGVAIRGHINTAARRNGQREAMYFPD